MSDDFTAPDVLNMFDHLHEDFKSESIEGKVFQIKWTKDKCKIRNHMFAQVGPIAIIYEKLGKKLPIIFFPPNKNFKDYHVLHLAKNKARNKEWKNHMR